MKKLHLLAFVLGILAAHVSLGQSSMYNPPYKPHARFGIPVVQQPEFSGTATNITTNVVYEVSGWSTNIVQFTTASNGLVSVTNIAPEFAAVDLVTTNTAAALATLPREYFDFLIYAIDEQTDEIILSFSSLPPLRGD